MSIYAYRYHEIKISPKILKRLLIKLLAGFEPALISYNLGHVDYAYKFCDFLLGDQFSIEYWHFFARASFWKL